MICDLWIEIPYQSSIYLSYLACMYSIGAVTATHAIPFHAPVTFRSAQ